MLEDFEAARRKRDRAIIGGKTGVAPFEDGHNNTPFPQSGNLTPGQGLKILSKGAVTKEILNKENGTPSRPTAESTQTPRARRNFDALIGPSKVPPDGKTSTEKIGPSPLQ